MKFPGQIVLGGLAIQQNTGWPICDQQQMLDRHNSLRQYNTSASNDTFKWESIKPSAKLALHPCFKGYKCARLEVPMDWNRTDGKGAKVAIAVMVQPAKVPVTDSRYGGPILLNPGGPGGSGVDFMFRYGTEIASVVNSPEVSSTVDADARYFDLISFDPRGIGLTTPGTACFKHSLARQAWDLQQEAIGLPGTSPTAISQLWARALAYGKGCTAKLLSEGHDEHPAEFVGTAYVARDMIEIIERYAEWREKEAAVLAKQAACKLDADTIQRTSWQKGKEMFQYWGFSYGTLLGSTTAALFPDRMKRIVLDGVVDADDYYSLGWSRNTNDADELFGLFFEYCNAAGPEKCKFWHKGGAHAIRELYDALVDIVRENPSEITSADGPGLVTVDDIENEVFSALYKPMRDFPILAEALYDLSNGNVSSFEKLKNDKRNPFCPSGACKTGLRASDECGGSWDSADAGSMVLCSDGDSTSNWTKAGFEKHWQQQKAQSKTIGSVWSVIPLRCLGSEIKSKWRQADVRGNTAHPILFAGNSWDPVTPVRNAFKMSDHFTGSSVLHLKGTGHCTLAAPSTCAAKIIRRYFHTGVLPANGTLCEADLLPFTGAASDVQAMSAEDLELLQGLTKLSHSWRTTGSGPLGV